MDEQTSDGSEGGALPDLPEEAYDEDAEELPVLDDGEAAEHPEEGLTEEEAAKGDELYRRIDDLDDESNGLDQ